MNLDHLFNRVYHEKDYNCLHFTAEVWAIITGENLLELTYDVINNTHKHFKCKRKFITLEKPESPCIVIMKRPCCNSHVGVFIDNRIIHLTELGVECYSIDIASRGFNKLRFVK